MYAYEMMRNPHHCCHTRHHRPHTHTHTDARSCHRADPLPQFVLSVTLSVSLSVSSPSADGIWFYAAPGSGMWLCTGQRTLVLPQASDRPKLKSAWLEKVTEASRSAAATDIRSLGDRKKGRDFFPLQAAALGYSTVQNLQGNYPLQGTAEIVAVSAGCMHGPEPIGTCPPRGLLTTGLPGRHGHGMHPCMCDSAEPTLNCAGVAWGRRQVSDDDGKGLTARVAQADP